MRQFSSKYPKLSYWLKFTGRTVLYFVIIMILIYLYHYKDVSGGAFIYNEF